MELQVLARFNAALIDALRFNNNRISVNQLQCLMIVAANDGITQGELNEIFDIEQSLVSSYLKALCGKSGAEAFIYKKDHPDDRRKQQLFLTKHGREFLQLALNNEKYYDKNTWRNIKHQIDEEDDE